MGDFKCLIGQSVSRSMPQALDHPTGQLRGHNPSLETVNQFTRRGSPRLPSSNHCVGWFVCGSSRRRSLASRVDCVPSI